MKALLTGMRLEGDQVVIFLKKRVLMGISQVPCVWRSLSCSSCIQLAAAGCKNVSKGAEYSDSNHYFINLSSTRQCAGHNRASCSQSDPRSNMFCTGESDNSETETEVKP